MFGLTFDKHPEDRFAKFVQTLPADGTIEWAEEHFRELIHEVIHQFECIDVCEIGGGRFPLFKQNELDNLGVRYAINDISQSELDRAPAWVHKTCFDIAGRIVPREEQGRYDLVFSKLVMEHVSSGQRAYENIFILLRPGGIFINFHPVLYAAPFVLNWILPDHLSRPVLKAFKPHRHDSGIPKFKAYYSNCVINDYTLNTIATIGFSHVSLIAFFGHKYFKNIFGLRELDNYVNNWARLNRNYLLASYCIAVGQK